MIKSLKKIVSLTAVIAMLICSFACTTGVSAATNGDNVRVSEVEFTGTKDAVSARVFVRNSGTPVECSLVLAVYNADKSLKSAAVCKGSNGILQAGTLDASGAGEIAKAFVWKAGDNSPIAEIADLGKSFDEVLNNIEITFDDTAFDSYIGEPFNPSNLVYSKTLRDGDPFPQIRVKSDNNAIKAKILTDEGQKKATITIEYGLENNIKEMYNWDGNNANAYHMIYSKENTRTYTINYTSENDTGDKLYSGDFSFDILTLAGNYNLAKWYEKHYDASETQPADISAYIDNWANQDTFIVVKADDPSATTKDVFLKADGSAVEGADIIDQYGNNVVKSIGTFDTVPLMLVEDFHAHNFDTGRSGTPTFYEAVESQTINPARQAVNSLTSAANELVGNWAVICDNNARSGSFSLKVKKPVTVYVLSLSGNTAIKDSPDSDANTWTDRSTEKAGCINCKYQNPTNIVTIAYMIKNGIIERSDLFGNGYFAQNKSVCYYSKNIKPFGKNYNIKDSTKGNKTITVDDKTVTIGDLLSNTAFSTDPGKEFVERLLDALLDTIGVGDGSGMGNPTGQILSNLSKDPSLLSAIVFGRFEYAPLKSAKSTMTDGTEKALYPGWSDRLTSNNFNSITYYPTVMNIYGAENIITGLEAIQAGPFGVNQSPVMTFKVNKDAEIIVFKRPGGRYIEDIPEADRAGWSNLDYYMNGVKKNNDEVLNAGIGVYYGTPIYQYSMAAAKEYAAGETVTIYGTGEKSGLMIIIKPVTR